MNNKKHIIFLIIILSCISTGLIITGCVDVKRDNPLDPNSENYTPPDNPSYEITNIKVLSHDRIKITWGIEEHGNQIYRNTENNTNTAIDLGAIRAKFWINKDLDPDTLYYYWLRTGYKEGLAPFSNPKSARTWMLGVDMELWGLGGPGGAGSPWLSDSDGMDAEVWPDFGITNSKGWRFYNSANISNYARRIRESTAISGNIMIEFYVKAVNSIENYEMAFELYSEDMVKTHFQMGWIPGSPAKFAINEGKDDGFVALSTSVNSDQWYLIQIEINDGFYNVTTYNFDQGILSNKQTIKANGTVPNMPWDIPRIGLRVTQMTSEVHDEEIIFDNIKIYRVEN